jgi:hypothetical protein
VPEEPKRAHLGLQRVPPVVRLARRHEHACPVHQLLELPADHFRIRPLSILGGDLEIRVSDDGTVGLVQLLGPQPRIREALHQRRLLPRLEPLQEGVPGDAEQLALGRAAHLLEIRIQPRFQRVLAEDTSAEAVDGPDERLVDVGERLADASFPHRPIPRALRQAAFEPLLKALAQLGRGLLGERHRGDPVHGRASCRDQLDHAIDHRLRLAGPCARLDKEVQVKVLDDPPSRHVVGQQLLNHHRSLPAAAHTAVRTPRQIRSAPSPTR